MGERLTISVFKNSDPESFRCACIDVISALGLANSLDGERADIRLLLGSEVHTTEQYHPGSFGISKLVAKRLDCVYALGYIQEGSLWECGLTRGDTHLGWFSTWPEYWGKKSPTKREAHTFAKRFAEAWGVPLERIERYLVPWGMKRISKGNPEKWWMRDGRVLAMNLEDAPITVPTLKGKAYPTDKHEYGSIWQLMDFLTAIGSKDPQLLWDKPDMVVPVYFPSDEEFRRRYDQVSKTWFGEQSRNTDS